MSEKESKGAMPSRVGHLSYKEEERSDDRRKMRRERSETIFRRGSVPLWDAIEEVYRVFDQPIWALRF